MGVRLPVAAAVTAVVAAVVAVGVTACGGIGPMMTTTSTVTVTVTEKQAAAREWTMPDEIGKDLQTAQDDMQALTGDPLFISTSKDLKGSRHQINDRNWKVCSSTPRAGDSFTKQTNVQFGVVKTGESCP